MERNVQAAAGSVAAVQDPLQCRFNLGKPGAALVQQGRGLGEFEGYGGAFGVVLVVDVGVQPRGAG